MTTIHVTDTTSRSAAQAAVAMAEPPFTVEIGGGWQPIDDDAKGGQVVFLWYDMKTNPHAAFDTKIKKGRWLKDLGEWQLENVGGNVAPNVAYYMPLPDPPNG